MYDSDEEKEEAYQDSLQPTIEEPTHPPPKPAVFRERTLTPTLTMSQATENLDHFGGPALLVLVASVSLALSSAFALGQGILSFVVTPEEERNLHIASLVLSTVSLILSATYMYMAPKENALPENIRLFMVFLLAMIWAGCLVTFTNYGPFVLAGNGFFSCWMGFVGAAWLLYREMANARTAANRASAAGPYLLVIVLASIVELIFAIRFCAIVACVNELGYAVAVGSVSLVVCAFYAFWQDGFADSLKLGFVIFMILWWAAAVLVLTYYSPFNFVSNGFLATWAGFLGSIFMGYNYYTTAPPISQRSLEMSAKA